MVSISKVREAQEVLQRALKELNEGVAREVEASQPLDGVKTLASNIVLVSASVIGTHDWAPTTYIPSSQVDAVRRALAPATNIDSFLEKLDNMLETRKVKIGKETISLNKKTLEALQSVKDEVNDM